MPRDCLSSLIGPYAASFFRAAQRFLCAAAIFARVAALKGRRFRLRPPSSTDGAEAASHFGGLPRRLWPPAASRSSTRMASVNRSRSARSSKSMLLISMKTQHRAEKTAVAWRVVYVKPLKKVWIEPFRGVGQNPPNPWS